MLPHTGTVEVPKQFQKLFSANDVKDPPRFFEDKSVDSLPEPPQSPQPHKSMFQCQQNLDATHQWLLDEKSSCEPSLFKKEKLQSQASEGKPTDTSTQRPVDEDTGKEEDKQPEDEESKKAVESKENSKPVEASASRSMTTSMFKPVDPPSLTKPTFDTTPEKSRKSDPAFDQSKSSDSDNESFPLLTLVEKAEAEPNLFLDQTISSDSSDESKKTMNMLSDNGATELIVDICSDSDEELESESGSLESSRCSRDASEKSQVENVFSHCLWELQQSIICTETINRKRDSKHSRKGRNAAQDKTNLR